MLLKVRALCGGVETLLPPGDHRAIPSPLSPTLAPAIGFRTLALMVPDGGPGRNLFTRPRALGPSGPLAGGLIPWQGPWARSGRVMAWEQTKLPLRPRGAGYPLGRTGSGQASPPPPPQRPVRPDITPLPPPPPPPLADIFAADDADAEAAADAAFLDADDLAALAARARRGPPGPPPSPRTRCCWAYF